MRAMALHAAENIEEWVRVNQHDVTPHILAQQIEHARTVRAYAEDRLLGPRKSVLCEFCDFDGRVLVEDELWTCPFCGAVQYYAQPNILRDVTS